MNSNQHNNKKRNVVIVAVLIVFLLITGTFAWKDYNQHKTNELKSDGLGDQDIVLVENFDRKHTLENGWKPGQTVEKEVYVRNKGTGNAVIRLELKEWAMLYENEANFSDLRYMINEEGDYIMSKEKDVIRAKEDLNSQIKGTNFESQGLVITEDMFYHEKKDIGKGTLVTPFNDGDLDKKRVVQVTIDEQDAWYIMTKADDANGQYGKHVSISQYNEGDLIVGKLNDEGNGPNNVGVTDQHHYHYYGRDRIINDDCNLYESIKYRDSNPYWEFYGELANRNALLSFGQDKDVPYIVSLTEYLKAPDAYEAGVWIYLDSKALLDGKVEGIEGEYAQNLELPEDYVDYVYWSEVLPAGEETRLVMDGISLLNPIDKLDYLFHIDMEAADPTTFRHYWHYVPKNLITKFTNQGR